MKSCITMAAAGLLLASLAPAHGAEWAAAPAAAASQPLSAAGEGRRAYLAFNCYGCHGMFAAGAMGPNIQHAEAGDIGEAVHQGEGGGMPSFGRKLTRQDIRNIGAYLRSIGTAAEPKFMDWWVPYPTK